MEVSVRGCFNSKEEHVFYKFNKSYKSHNMEKNPNQVAQVKPHRSFEKSKKITSKGSNIHCWLNWVCSSLKLFSFVDDVLTREYSILEPISHNSLKNYMELVTKEVGKPIQAALPEKFALVIDIWTKISTHFVGVFAS